MYRYLLVINFCIIIFSNTVAQQRWTQNYFEGENPYGESITKSYDNGYLLVGRYGPNYPNNCWLLKVNVNGDILWNKVIGDDNSVIFFGDIKQDSHGNIYLAGSTYYYGENNSDPLIIKLNSCGEKEWCRVFIEDGNNYSTALEITADGNIAFTLRYMNPDISNDRICMGMLSGNGDLIFKTCYNSSDSSIYSEEVKDITKCPDKGFLISGRCYYEDVDPPHYLWMKPYYIKTDSLGNFEWETVVQPDADDPGGAAWSTVLSPDSNYFYSSLSRYYYNPVKDAPALLKMDMQGNVIGIYDIEEPDERGKLVNAKFVNDSVLMASASWGHEPESSPKAVLIDTLGNMINSAFLLDNGWMANTEVTFDNKLLFLTNDVDDYDNFSTYLFKLNQELESDTVYTANFNYDSLCPYQIVSDTIVQDNCGLIVGNEEIHASSNISHGSILVYPNPTSESFTIETDNYQSNESTIYIYDIQGKIVKTLNISENGSNTKINVKGWKKGLYLIRLYDKNGNMDTGKIMVQ